MNFNTLLFTLIILSSSLFSQSKKEIKKYKIKASLITSTENGKTLNESKIIYDSNGNPVEKTNYAKDGSVKTINKIKYNDNGDDIEDNEYDASNKLIEKNNNQIQC
jgi:hypothetical protein